MRGTVLFLMLVNLIGASLDLVLIVQARHEGVPTHFIGPILAAFAAGGILGAPCIPRLHALLRPGHLLIALGLTIALGCLMIAVLPLGGFWMAGWLAAIGFAVPAIQVLVDVLIIRQVPDHQRGRALSAVMTLNGLGLPLGAAFGGSLLQAASAETLLLGTAAAMAAIAALAASQRALRVARWPAAS
jgi:predicted MFS family arabinose efflux permease